MSVLFFILTELFYSYIVGKGMRAVSGARRTQKWVEIASCLGYVSVTGMVYLLWNIPVLTLLSNIIMLFLLSLNYEDKLTGRIFHVFILVIFLVSSETFAMMLMNQTGISSIEKNELDNNVVLISLECLLQLCAVILIEKFGKERKEERFSFWQLFVFLLIELGSLYLEVVLFVDLYEKRPALVMITNLIIMIINIAVVWIYKMLSEQYRMRERASLNQMKNEAYENELKAMKEKEASIRRLRHDMKNHCLILEGYLKRGEHSEAENYLEKMLDKLAAEKTWIQTGNQVIDSFINYKFSKAEELNILCSVQSNLPKELPLEDFSMVCILGNLLDNAIAAAKEAAEPQIKVKFSYLKHNLCIVIWNTYHGTLQYKEGKLVTGQMNKNIHGYGLMSVEQEVERCRGTIRIEHDEESFEVVVLIPA